MHAGNYLSTVMHGLVRGQRACRHPPRCSHLVAQLVEGSMTEIILHAHEGGVTLQKVNMDGVQPCGPAAMPQCGRLCKNDIQLSHETYATQVRLVAAAATTVILLR